MTNRLSNQIANIQKVLDFLPSIPAGKFYGDRISLVQSEKNDEGCVLHWMFHKKRLPAPLHVAMATCGATRGYRGSRLIKNTDVRAAIDVAYGEAAAHLFDKGASECERDLGLFKCKVQYHLDKLNGLLSVNPEPVAESFIVRYNSVEVMYTDRAAMEADVASLKKYIKDATPEIFLKVS